MKFILIFHSQFVFKNYLFKTVIAIVLKKKRTFLSLVECNFNSIVNIYFM